MHVDDYAGRDGMLALFHVCAQMVSDGDLGGLITALSTKASRTFEKQEVPRIAAAAIVALGRTGVDQLLVFLTKDRFGGIRGLAALHALWLAAAGRSVIESSLGIYYPELPVDADTRAYARSALDDFIASASTDADKYHLLLELQAGEITLGASQSDEAVGARLPPFTAHVLEVLRDSSIILTTDLIERFERLVSQDCAEDEYQAFLAAHPVFLDPLAAEIVDRQRLGLEFVTDFVIRKHDGTYVVVEIEKPQDRLFTVANNFTAAFTHASGQVLDFQGWVAENIAYARSLLPNIEAPQGLLIMGRRAGLSNRQAAKLRHWVFNSSRIDVLTFDDLCIRARALHASLRPHA